MDYDDRDEDLGETHADNLERFRRENPNWTREECVAYLEGGEEEPD